MHSSITVLQYKGIIKTTSVNAAARSHWVKPCLATQTVHTAVRSINLCYIHHITTPIFHQTFSFISWKNLLNYFRDLVRNSLRVSLHCVCLGGRDVICADVDLCILCTSCAKRINQAHSSPSKASEMAEI